MKLTCLIPLLLLCLPGLNLAAAPSIVELMHEGNEQRLRGNMTAANKIKNEIRELDPEDPASYAFNLNTLITELSWEESQTRFDEELIRDAEQLLELCEDEAPSRSSVDNPDYYCGQAHFVLSYFNGIRGNYIRAGRHGSSAIDHLEAALAQDPELIRAKMYLGIAYYYADNLPSFIRLFSRVLWFIPSGNSSKSLPYLREVMNSNDNFNDVARYIYATLLINGTDAEVADAVSELEILLARYPENARFQLRYVSVLLGNEKYRETLDQINRYMASPYAVQLNKVDANLMKIWTARAYLGLARVEQAIRVQKSIDLGSGVGTNSHGTPVPAWGLAWHELTAGQLSDLLGNRQAAIASYDRLIAMDEKTFINPALVERAKLLRQTPFKLPAGSVNLEPDL